MTDQPTSHNDDREIPGLEEHLDQADQDTRIGSDETDDLPVTPPDLQPRATEREMAGWSDEGESIEQRIVQEEPDPDSAYGAPENESGLDTPARVGGDDPDSIAADEDFLGEGGDAVESAPDDPAEEVALRVEDDENL